MKKRLFVVLTCMVLGIFLMDGFTVQAEETREILYSGKSGNLDWTIDESGCLTITGVGDYAAWEYDEDSESWFLTETWWGDYSDYITSAVVDVQGITFTVRMFDGLMNLKTVDLSKLDTKNVINMNNMFTWCESLSELNLSNFDTSSVKNMESMFYECNGLKKLDLSNFDTSNVEDMGYMFCACRSLQELDLSNFDTSNVWNMSGMFSDCNTLNNLDLNNFDTKNVTLMRNMFDGCESLKKLHLNNFNTSNVWDMDWMFSGCNSLIELDVSSFDMSSVIDVRAMLSSCNNLTKIIAPANINIPTEIDLPEVEGYVWKDEAGKTVTYLQKGLSKPMTYIRILGAIVGTKHTFSNGIYKITKSSSKSKEVTFVKPKSNKKTSFTIPATIKISGKTYKVTEIASKAFKNNKKLKSVTIGKNVKQIGTETFSGCKKLKKITIKGTMLKSVGKNAIKGIDKKATIKVPKKQLSKYKKLFKSKTGYKKTMKIKK